MLIPEMCTISVAVCTVLARDPHPEETLEINHKTCWKKCLTKST